MKYSLEDVKLKHLDLISGDDVDFIKIMTEVFGYKNTWIDKHIMFRFKCQKMLNVVSRVRSAEISQTHLMEGVSIEVPKSIDSISFQARLEINTVIEKADSTIDKMASVIALACYSTQHKAKFNSDSMAYERFKDSVLDQPLLYMLNLFNVIQTKLNESNELWNSLFKQVEVLDHDYDESGGPTFLDRFSLLKTIKSAQKDFRTGYKETFLLSYSLIQWNNLEKQSSNYVQERMTSVKEKRMKRERQK